MRGQKSHDEKENWNIMDHARFFSTSLEELQKNIHHLKAQAMRAYGLGASDLNCLMMLKKYPDGLTSTELSSECRVDKALISRTVKKLIGEKIIVYAHPRLPAPTVPSDSEPKTGRRGAYRVRLILTEKGEQVAQALYDVTKKAISSVMEGLNEADLTVFLSVLENLSQKLSDYMDQSHVVAHEIL